MKKILITTLALIAFYASSAQDCKPKKEYASVEQERGVYIFVDCKPLAEYKFLGTVKAGSALGKAMVGARQYEEKKNALIKKTTKEYPNADGVILHFNSGEADTADAIKFKED